MNENTKNDQNKTMTGFPDLLPEGGFRRDQLMALAARPLDPDRPATLFSSALIVSNMRKQLNRPMFLSLEMEANDRLLDCIVGIPRIMEIDQETHKRLMGMGRMLKEFDQTMAMGCASVAKVIVHKTRTDKMIFDSLRWLMEESSAVEQPTDKPKKNRVKKERYNPNAKDRLQQSLSAKKEIKPNPLFAKLGIRNE